MAKNQSSESGKKPVGRHPVRRFFKYLSLALLLLFVGIVGALGWITQSESGQRWLASTVNSLLASHEADGLSFRLTSLSGTIPFNFQFGIESEDRQGVWLAAPGNRLVWNWRELPGMIHIQSLQLEAVDISRLPDLPAKKEEEAPAAPLTVKDIQGALKQVADFLNVRHWWLPQIQLDKAEVAITLPQGLPFDKQRLLTTADLNLSFLDNSLKADARLLARNSADEKLTLPDAEIETMAINLAVQGKPAGEGIALNCRLAADAAGLALDLKELPADFLGSAPTLSLNMDAEAGAGGAAITLTGPKLSAGHVQLDAAGNWHSDEGWQAGQLSGPLACDINLALAPLADDADSELKALKAPLKLSLTAAGNLARPSLECALECAEIEASGKAVTNVQMLLKGAELELPFKGSFIDFVQQENHLDFNLSAQVERQPVALSTLLFFQHFAVRPEPCWRIGLRNFALDALGLSGKGNLALLAGGANDPALDGSLRFSIRNWEALGKIVPDIRFSGSASLDLDLKSGLGGELANPDVKVAALPDRLGDLEQGGIAELSVPSLIMRQAKGKPFELTNAHAAITLSDVFKKGNLDAKFNLGSISAAGLRLNGRGTVSGPFAGPLKAEIASNGSVNSSIAVGWQPGRVDIGKLDIKADLGSFLQMKGAGKLVAGVRSVQPAQLFYGPDGYRIQGLDVQLLPGGRLTAAGGLSPHKLDLNLNLSRLDLKAFKTLFPELPTGLVAATVNLQGSPERPGGNFRLALTNISSPWLALSPASLAVVGDVVNVPGGAALKTRLEINPATVKALGGTVADINATLPLLFGKDGLPNLNPDGPLQARVNWDGALGPIWNLFPIPDRRLNGRLALNASCGGTVAKPAIRGSATISHARYEDLEFGVLLTDINLKLDLGGPEKQSKTRRGALDNLPGAFRLALNLSDGLGGSLVANGSGDLDGENLDVKAKITDLKPLRRRDIHVQLSGNLGATGSVKAPLIDGEIIVDKGEVLLNNLAMTGSVVTLDITNPAEQKAAPAPKAASGIGGRLNVRIRMLPRFSVEGRGLASLWQCNLLVSGPLSDPQVTGAINSVRGNFDFLGKVFALTRGRVFFGGGSLSNPLVDVELTYDTPDIIAHIVVAGPVNKIRLTITSDPVMPRDEIISRVLFGRSVNDLSRMEALQLAGAVAQLAGFGGGSSMLGSVKKALGVDVLRIGTANTGSSSQSSDDTGGGTTLEMGKYLNDYIYMGVQQGFKADSTAFIIEIELSPHSSLELRTEQNNTWGGIKWRKNY